MDEHRGVVRDMHRYRGVLRDVLEGVTQRVGEVVCGVDAPVVVCPLMMVVLNTVGHRVKLPIL